MTEPAGGALPGGPASPVSAPGPEQRSSAPDRSLNRLLIAGITLLTMVVGVYAVLYLPWWMGAAPIPLSAVVASAVLFWAVRACFALVPSLRLAAVPAVGWLGVTLWMSVSRTLGYPLVIGDWRFVLLLAGGVLTAAIALIGCWTRTVLRTDVPRNTVRSAR